MAVSDIYVNIKKYLQIFGHEILDNFIQPDHPEELDPRKRYDNFDWQFNHHVGTSEHFQLNQGVELPYLAIDITPVGCREGCFQKYRIRFSVYYSTVSPPTGRVCIENTPEGKLEYRDRIVCLINQMLDHPVRTIRGWKRMSFADEVATLENWKRPIRTQLISVDCFSDFVNETTKEVEMFSIPVTLSLFYCL